MSLRNNNEESINYKDEAKESSELKGVNLNT